MPDRKTPQEKKRLSLKRDRRNVYGENDKASRKAIPRRKRLGQKQLRRGINQALSPLGGKAIEDHLDQVASEVNAVQAAKKHKLFKKSPDQPLGIVLERQRQWREAAQNPRKSPRT